MREKTRWRGALHQIKSTRPSEGFRTADKVPHRPFLLRFAATRIDTAFPRFCNWQILIAILPSRVFWRNRACFNLRAIAAQVAA